jgi:protein phosphatase
VLQTSELTHSPVNDWLAEANRQRIRGYRSPQSESGSMTSQPLVQYASRTDVGMRRSANQDSLAVRLCSEADEWAKLGHLFVVADGMGGHAVGDLASRIAVETLPHAYVKSDAEALADRLRDAVVAANLAINDKARENPEFTDMGTTCSAMTLSAEGALVGHVGDSRVYRVRGGRIQQLTFDHSLQWEMIRQGHATAENVDLLHPRNVITRCLGPDQNVRVDVEGPFDVRKGDRFVLCSDGLTGHISDQEIGAIVSHLSPSESSRLLINLANYRGGSDNSTVVVVQVQDYPEVAGPVVDRRSSDANSGRLKGRQARGTERSLWSQISLAIFAVLSSFGLIFLVTDRRILGLVMISAALLQGFVRLVIAASRGRRADDVPEQEAPLDTSPTIQMLTPTSKSPYRSASAVLTGDLLDYAGTTQSELTQVAQENGWTIDTDKLAELNRTASTAFEEKRGAQCLKLRAKAIDLLMRQVYSRSRER